MKKQYFDDLISDFVPPDFMSPDDFKPVVFDVRFLRKFLQKEVKNGKQKSPSYFSDIIKRRFR